MNELLSLIYRYRRGQRGRAKPKKRVWWLNSVNSIRQKRTWPLVEKWTGKKVRRAKRMKSLSADWWAHIETFLYPRVRHAYDLILPDFFHSSLFCYNVFDAQIAACSFLFKSVPFWCWKKVAAAAERNLFDNIWKQFSIHSCSIKFPQKDRFDWINNFISFEIFFLLLS